MKCILNKLKRLLLSVIVIVGCLVGIYTLMRASIYGYVYLQLYTPKALQWIWADDPYSY